MQMNVIQINPADNVAVAIGPVERGERLVGAGCDDVTAATDIPRHHKVALQEIAKDQPIVKYGETIALAGTTIRPGEWVHTHNIIA